MLTEYYCQLCNRNFFCDHSIFTREDVPCPYCSIKGVKQHSLMKNYNVQNPLASLTWFQLGLEAYKILPAQDIILNETKQK